MTFRINSPIDSNQHKGLLALNSISASPLAVTGLSLTNAQPIHVAIVDTAGSQVVPTSGTATSSINVAQVNGTTAVTAGVNGLLAVGGNIASAATDSGNPVKVGGVYNSSNITLTNGQRGDVQLDVNGFVRATLATLIAGENLTSNRLNVEPIYSFTNMTSATTTTAKSGAGTLHAITVNTPVASATIKIFDNTTNSGTSIGIITLGGTLANDQTSTYLYDASFTTGLTIQTSASTDITILYR